MAQSKQFMITLCVSSTCAVSLTTGTVQFSRYLAERTHNQERRTKLYSTLNKHIPYIVFQTELEMYRNKYYCTCSFFNWGGRSKLFFVWLRWWFVFRRTLFGENLLVTRALLNHWLYRKIWSFGNRALNIFCQLREENVKCVPIGLKIKNS